VWLSPPVPTVSGSSRRFSQLWITPSPGRRLTPPRLLMKLGSYAILRIALPLLPAGAAHWLPWVAVLCCFNIIYGGYVGINHYQNAKAAVNALPVVADGGVIILAACERDDDPIGPATYKTLLHLLKLQGPDGYLATLMSPTWRFTKDQWEPQMWGKVLGKVGEEGLIYCSARLSRDEHQLVPGGMGWDYLPDGTFADDAAAAQTMVQNAVIVAVRHPRWRAGQPSVAFIKEGPYAVPVRNSGHASV